MTYGDNIKVHLSKIKDT